MVELMLLIGLLFQQFSLVLLFSNNIFIGYVSGGSACSTSNSVYIGSQAGQSAKCATNNAYIGYGAEAPRHVVLDVVLPLDNMPDIVIKVTTIFS